MTAESRVSISVPLDPQLRADYLRLIESSFGLRLTGHQARGFDEALERLLSMSEGANAGELFDILAAGRRRDLLQELASGLTVGETHFFRVAPQIDALRQVVLPDLAGKRRAARRLRIWSAGCSTGEEPYTLAILLRQHFGILGEREIQLLATDISRSALEAARAATYGEWSFRETPEEVRRNYFVPVEGRWRLVEPIRSMVCFSLLNLAADPFPAPGPDGRGFDLILCRNVTIYFALEAAQGLYRRFAQALEPGGWLVLGPSDPAPCQPGPLEPVWLPAAVLWRRPREQRPAAHERAPEQSGSASLSLSSPAGAAGASPARFPGEGDAGAVDLPLVPAGRRPAIPAGEPPSGDDDPCLSDLDRAWTLAHAGERREARRLGEEMERVRPLEAGIHLFLGMLGLEDGAETAAIESLRRAAFLAPDHPLAHFGLGRAYLRLGKEQRALAALSQARRLLAAAPDGEVIPFSGGLLVGDLRGAVDAQLGGLKQAGGP